jgi:hypothetical protein
VYCFAHGIVRNGFLFPTSGDRGITRDAKLHNETRTNTKEARIIEESSADEIEKTIGSAWRPFSMRFNDEIAFAGLKFYLENFRRGFVLCRSTIRRSGSGQDGKK